MRYNRGTKSPIGRGMTVLARHPSGWRLEHNQNFSTHEWYSIVLRRMNRLRRIEKDKKKTFWIGWNGERFPQTNEVRLMKEKRPDLTEWVEAQLKKLPPPVSFQPKIKFSAP